MSKSTDPPGDGSDTHRMWGGRFGAASEKALLELNNSLRVDHRLWPHDIRAAKAWVNALGGADMLDDQERQRLLHGLDRVAERLRDGDGANASDEDVHTLVERLLFEEVGELAGKLNTGRSRNDQVATDLRIWCLEAAKSVDGEIAELGEALVDQARRGIDILLPGYTHGQRAQPVRWAYVLLAHAWPIVRDRRRLANMQELLSELPLGVSALAGSAVNVDREELRHALGFRRISPNGLDVTGDRDFVAEFLFGLSLIAAHVSRLATELLLYASQEYGFVRISERFCTGSSLMPQKRNPDVLELARSKASRIAGNLAAVLSMFRSLPAGYSKDLQEDKESLFDAVDTVLLTTRAVRGTVESCEANAERMRQALEPAMLATDVADGLVLRGVPFRTAHGLVGELVRAAEEAGVGLDRVPADVASSIHADLVEVIQSLGSWEDSVERRGTVGGSSRASVERQIEDLVEEVARNRH